MIDIVLKKNFLMFKLINYVLSIMWPRHDDGSINFLQSNLIPSKKKIKAPTITAGQRIASKNCLLLKMPNACVLFGKGKYLSRKLLSGRLWIAKWSNSIGLFSISHKSKRGC